MFWRVHFQGFKTIFTFYSRAYPGHNFFRKLFVNSSKGAEGVKAALEAHEVIVVTFAADQSLFISVADSYDDVTFATLDEAAAKELQVDADQIAIFKKFDEGRVNYEGESNKDDILAFIKLESLPLVNEFNEETAPKIFGGEIMQHLLLFAAKSGSTFDDERAGFAEAAKSHKGMASKSEFLAFFLKTAYCSKKLSANMVQ